MSFKYMYIFHIYEFTYMNFHVRFHITHFTLKVTKQNKKGIEFEHNFKVSKYFLISATVGMLDHKDVLIPEQIK